MKGTRALSCLFGVFVGLTTALLAEGPRVRGIDREVHSGLSDSVAGVVLVRELGCAHCHPDTTGQFHPRPAPDLEAIGSVLDPLYLQSFLADPHGTIPGTVMPNSLRRLDGSSRAETVRALVQFLHSGPPSSAALPEVTEEQIEKGEALYLSIGCVPCHGVPTDGTDGFSNLATKFSREGLHQFLLDPVKYRPSGRMPDMHLDYDEALQLTAFLMPTNGDQEPFVLEGGLVEKGRQIALDSQCLDCHSGGSDVTRGVERALDQLNLDSGCLSGTKGDWPDYSLSEHERRIIGEALSSEEDLPVSIEVEVVLRQFNCVACHERDGYGGPAIELERYFQTSDLNLGDQGRLPPALDGVGAKLNPVWFRKLLFQEGAARPYMKTRMPRFASHELDPLLERLSELDRLEPVAAVQFQEPRRASGHGRTLAGTDGLACITCHTFKGKKVGAMGALDMNLMAQRLTRDWFHRYLLSPTDFSPSTLMPPFWNGDESPLPEILEGDVGQQIEALWIYASEGYSLGTPKGVRREPMQLLATEDEAVMLRRSYPGVGKRGIGVGYPGNVNLVFDADGLGLAMVWQGGFIDPSGVFLSQGHGTARPLARRPVRFRKGPEIMPLASLQSPWPAVDGAKKNRAFKGYTLDSSRQPIFRYEVQEWQIEDAVVPYSNNGMKGLQRRIRMTGEIEKGVLVLRLAGDKPWNRASRRRYRLPDGLTLELPQGIDGLLVNTSEGNELRVRLGGGGEGMHQEIILNYLFEKE